MEMKENSADLYQIILPDQRTFAYKIEPYELTNFLGAQVAVLQEYSIQNKAGEIYKLYKTAEGNWYDIAEEIESARNVLLRMLKSAIDKNEGY